MVGAEMSIVRARNEELMRTVITLE